MINPVYAAEVSATLAADESSLYTLADQLVHAAPARRWNLFVTDECSAHFLPGFFSTVLRRCNGEESVPDLQIGIANTESEAMNTHHDHAVYTYLRNLPIHGRRALVLTEHVNNGDALQRLTDHLQQVGAATIDAAVMTSRHNASSSYWRSWVPGETYLGGVNAGGPTMYGTIVGTGSGYRSVLGQAVPQLNPRADQELAAHIAGAFDALAVTYSQQHTAVPRPLR